MGDPPLFGYQSPSLYDEYSYPSPDPQLFNFNSPSLHPQFGFNGSELAECSTLDTLKPSTLGDMTADEIFELRPQTIRVDQLKDLRTLIEQFQDIEEFRHVRKESAGLLWDRIIQEMTFPTAKPAGAHLPVNTYLERPIINLHPSHASPPSGLVHEPASKFEELFEDNEGLEEDMEAPLPQQSASYPLSVLALEPVSRVAAVMAQIDEHLRVRLLDTRSNPPSLTALSCSLGAWRMPQKLSTCFLKTRLSQCSPRRTAGSMDALHIKQVGIGGVHTITI